MSPGILLIDKPQGITSFDVIRHLRRISGCKSFGHTGTLDPLATGMLPILCGHATRYASYIQSHHKAYETVIQFGQATDTDDSDGQITAHSDKRITFSQLSECAQYFTGTYNQKAPMAAAIKVDGKKLYEYLRTQTTPPRIPHRRVHISNIQIRYFDDTLQRAHLTVTCESGTYIRALARDMGEYHHHYAHVSALRRLWVDPFQAHSMTALSDIRTTTDLANIIIPTGQAFTGQPTYLDDAEWLDLRHGKTISRVQQPDQDISPLYHHDIFVGLGQWQGHTLKSIRLQPT